MQNWKEHISINPEIRFGKPCITGTRITVDDILGWLASNMSYDEIVEDFPSLIRENILASLAFAAHRGENTKVSMSAA
ncbi:MAG: DUF433 domain-containing protein [Emticicia sp.]|nr:DUF433 domain-containing protein [Emticicia sp.]